MVQFQRFMYSMLAKEYGISQEQVDALCKDWNDTFGDYTVVFPQARRVVEQLKKKYKGGHRHQRQFANAAA